MRRSCSRPRPRDTSPAAPASSTPVPRRSRWSASDAASDKRPLEALSVARARPGEHDPRVLGRVLLQLPDHQAAGLGGGRPVDQVRLVTRPVRTQIVEVMPPPAPARRRLAAHGPADVARAHGVHGGIHEHLLVEEQRRTRLDEEPEGEPRGGAKPRQPAPAARGQRDLPSHDTLGAGREARDVREPARRAEPTAVLQSDDAQPVVERPARAPAGEEGAPLRRRAVESLERDGVRREPALPVGKRRRSRARAGWRGWRPAAPP